jgi:hypothetical protein
MKTYKILSVVGLSVFGVFFGQQADSQSFNKMTSEQRKETLAKLKTPDEKRAFMRQFQEDELVRKLNINEEKEKQFRPLFLSYMQSQREIKNQFNKKVDFESLTDQEAKTELDNSFVVGQKLLENRKKYAQDFLKILSPKQVLQLFHSEMKFRGQIEDKKYHHIEK